MKEKYLQEKIKLLTEWLRGFYGLLILISSGSATIFLKIMFLPNNIDVNIELKYRIINYITFTGSILDVIVIILILIVNKKINNFIHKLNQL